MACSSYFASILLLLRNIEAVHTYSMTDTKRIHMHQQITLEVEKLRRLQIEMFTQSTANNFLGFMLITVISEAVIIVAVILIIQEDSMRLHESEIMNFGKIFYTKWVKETTENEELNGIPIIDFTFHEGRNNKFIEPLEMISINKFKIADKNTTTLPLWAVCMQLAFTALIALTISHAMLCWNFTSQPVPLILLDFCMLEKEMYENHCKQYLREEYPLTISNDLQTITRQVEENYNLYLSALDDKRQKLKLAVLPVGISYLLLLLVIFSSVLNSLLRNFIQKQNSVRCKLSRCQQKICAILDISSILIIVCIYLLIYKEQASANEFKSRLEHCYQKLSSLFC